MQKWIFVAGGVAVAGAAAFFVFKPSPEEQLREHWTMVDRYCVECHNDAELTADLSFEGRGPDDVHADPGVWEEVLRKLKIHAMPPRASRTRGSRAFGLRWRRTIPPACRGSRTVSWKVPTASRA